MDQTLKQRLVGAIVITALAAIFLPMLFDDPVNERSQRINNLTIPPVPEKIQQARARKIPESVQDIRKTPVKPSSRHQSRPGQTGFENWYIQAGGFSVRENAEKLKNRLRQQGFSASVVKKTSPQGVLFKVRVGPELSREQAERIKVRLEKLNQLNSFITQEKTPS